MTSFARIVVDQAHGHLFLSPGRSGNALMVTDLVGTEVGRSGPIAGATGMALTPDGSSLWVEAATGDALVRVDTSSLAFVQRVALPSGTCPGDVAVVGTRSSTATTTSIYVGQLVTVSGVLSSGQAALPGSAVTVRRSCNGSNATIVGTVLTGTGGSYAVSDSPPEGTCAYQASFAGDNTYLAGSASVSVKVQRPVTSLTISQVRGTGRAKKTITITAHLGTTHLNRVVTLTAAPSGGRP
jgi:hypothetical protein